MTSNVATMATLRQQVLFLKPMRAWCPRPRSRTAAACHCRYSPCSLANGRICQKNLSFLEDIGRVSYRFPWYRLSDEHLLDLRICDLALKIKGSFLEPHIKRLYSELTTAAFASSRMFGFLKSGFRPTACRGLPFRFTSPTRV